MLWVFVIIGLVTSASILGRLALAMIRRQRSGWIEIMALVPLAVAWIAQHTTVVGWVAMLLALALELLRWATTTVPVKTRAGGTASRRSAPSCETLTEIATPDARTDGPVRPARDAVAVSEAAAAAAPPQPARPTEPPLECVSVAVLRTVAAAAPDVFHASLRRMGCRDAELMATSSRDRQVGAAPDAGPFWVLAGSIELEVSAKSTPVDAAQIEFAVAQSWDWPEAAGAVSSHEGHVVFRSYRPATVGRAEVVDLHHRAHAAVAEFAPVVAVLWPGAGRLISAAAMPRSSPGLADAAALARSCISFRACPLEEGESQGFVSDTVGLSGFGLPDLQVVSRNEPDEEVSSLVYELAQRFFAVGCDLREGQTLEGADGQQWSVHFTKSMCPPDRDVVQLVRQTEAGQPGSVDSAGPNSAGASPGTC